MKFVRALTERVAVLPWYHQPRSALQNLTTKTTLFGLCVFLGLFYGFACALTLPAGAVPLAIPVLILAVIAIWALPDVPGAPYPRWTVRLVFAFFLAMSVWPDYLSIALPGLPWISMRRLASFPLGIVLIVTLSQRSELRKRLGDIFRSDAWLSRFIIAFFLCQLLATLTGSPFYPALNRWIVALFNWDALLIASAIIFSYGGNTERWIRWFAVFAILMCLLNFAEVWNQQLLWAKALFHLPRFMAVDSEMAEGLVRQSPWTKYRAKGIFSTSLSFAEYMALAAPFLTLYVFRAKHLGSQVVLGGLNIMLIAALFTNGSRLGLVGALVGYSVCIYLFVVQYRHENPRNVLASALFYLMPVGFAAMAIAIKSFGRLNALFFGTGMQIISTEARWDQLDKMPSVLIRRPLFGFGPGNGGTALDYHQPGGLLTVDSYFISGFLDYGVLGGIAFFGSIIAGIVLALRLGLNEANPRRSTAMAIAGSLIIYLIVRFVLSQEDNQPLLFLLLGMVLAEAYKWRQSAPAEPEMATSSSSVTRGELEMA